MGRQRRWLAKIGEWGIRHQTYVGYTHTDSLTQADSLTHTHSYVWTISNTSVDVFRSFSHIPKEHAQYFSQITNGNQELFKSKHPIHLWYIPQSLTHLWYLPHPPQFVIWLWTSIPVITRAALAQSHPIIAQDTRYCKLKRPEHLNDAY